jgi:hypothetical protein
MLMPNTARQVIPKSDTDYGNVGSGTLRTAAQIGNANGEADFNDGPITGQTLRVTLATGTSIGLTPVDTGVYTYGENNSVAPSSTIVITSFTPTSDFFLLSVLASGDADGDFFVRIGGMTVSKKRNCWTDRNMDFTWGRNGILVPSGTLIEFVVTHKGQTSSAFNGTIYGEE